MKHTLITFEVDAKDLPYTLKLINDFSANLEELHHGLLFYKTFRTAAKPNKFIQLISFASDIDYQNYRKHISTKKFTVKLHALSKVQPLFTELSEVVAEVIKSSE
jgi:hypothetical protein